MGTFLKNFLLTHTCYPECKRAAQPYCHIFCEPTYRPQSYLLSVSCKLGVCNCNFLSFKTNDFLFWPGMNSFSSLASQFFLDTGQNLQIQGEISLKIYTVVKTFLYINF